MAALPTSSNLGDESLGYIQDHLNEILRKTFGSFLENVKAFTRELSKDKADSLSALLKMLRVLTKLFDERLFAFDKYMRTSLLTEPARHTHPLHGSRRIEQEELEEKLTEIKALRMKHHCLALEVQRSRLEVMRLKELKAITTKYTL